MYVLFLFFIEGYIHYKKKKSPSSKRNAQDETA